MKPSFHPAFQFINQLDQWPAMDDFPSPPQPHRTVQLSDYDPAWPLMYAELEGRLKKALGSNLLEIHHVGSTAIPGMSGKPRIDILATAQDRSIAIPLIQSLGFEHQGEQFVPAREGFRLRVPIQSNLHLFMPGHPEVETMLFFRNLLRSDPEARMRYEEAKRALIKEQRHFERLNPWFSEYTDKKGAAVLRILRDSGFRTLRMVRPINPLEWQEASELLGLPPDRLKAETAPGAKLDCLILLEGVDHVGAALVPTDRTHLPTVVLKASTDHEKQLESRFRDLIRQLFEVAP